MKKPNIYTCVIVGVAIAFLMTRRPSAAPADQARAVCRGEISRLAKDPESIEFGESWAKETAPGMWTVYREFRARNSFGAMTRGARTCTLKKTPEGFTLLAVAK